MKSEIEALRDKLSDQDILSIMYGNCRLSLSDSTKAGIHKAHQYLQRRLKKNASLIYGINTGFGSLCNVAISEDDIRQLQLNLIRSHACGAGPKVPVTIVRLILFLKIRSLSYGYSGVTVALVERLVDLYNHDAIPVIYEQGSLGASGDLAPLAHLAQPLIGEGFINQAGEEIPASRFLTQNGLHPYKFHAKEGLAMINGTQFSLAYLLAARMMASQIEYAARFTGALSLEGFDCHTEPFLSAIQDIRSGNGQPEVAGHIRRILEGSDHMNEKKLYVQDPYSFRCIPQVHGASFNAIRHVKAVAEAELFSVTDNPNIFADADLIASGGNFHAQPLALASDYLCMAVSELGSISERRIYLLVSGQRGLSPFLTTNAGLESGFMIAQYTAAAIASQNKQLCTPASIDSIVSSNGQEDHVSMAANAGVKALRVMENTATILAIEWQTAAQAVEMKNYAISPLLKKLLGKYRNFVSLVDTDRSLQPDFEATKRFFEEINWFGEWT